ncbi:flagellar motor protein MotB [Teredinibacter turnerae]|uniref:flagellar motor protein MotB n=1 Tax=Teredinibacter turnerae TaxID=2426 RepID=UPI0004055785|nr:flagellar motor protein MotB [Teredinibacter turnerae]
MIRRPPVETKINHERWLVSYADFVTLLFGFFVVMYSVSQVSETKYRTLSETLSGAFSGAEQAPPANLTRTALVAPDDLLTTLNAVLSQQIGAGMVTVTGNEDWVEIAVKSQLLFASGSAAPSATAQQVFSELADVLAPFENAIAVSGHTDNVPIRNQQFQNNWELSAARAVAVVNLLAYAGVAPERLAATGYGEFQPVADNNSAQGRAANRRVVLRIARTKREAPRLPASDAVEASPSPSPVPVPIPGPASEEPEAARDVQNRRAVDSAEESAIDYRETAPIKPVKLNNGGLLFTSDPDQARGKE